MTEYRNGSTCGDDCAQHGTPKRRYVKEPKPVKFEYMIRPADPADRAIHPDATQIILVKDRKIVRVLAVFQLEATARLIAHNLGQHAELQIR
jgi:hypothetical protein